MADDQTRTGAVVYQFGDLPGVLRIESAEALRALGHPLRAAILKELGSPRSVKEVAQSLQLPVARLYHHVKQLLAHGFIAEVEQRKAGSNTERLYQVAAGRIEVSGELTGPWREAADDVGTMVETTARRFAQAFREEGSRRASGVCGNPAEAWFLEAIVHLDPDEAADLVERLRVVMADVSARARRPVPGSRTPPQPRLGIQLAVVPFPPSRERRYAEMRTDDPNDPTPRRRSPRSKP